MPRSSWLTFALAALACVTGVAPFAPAQAQVLDPAFPVADGAVRACLVAGTTLYVGGEFTYIGPPTGSAALVDASSASVIPAFPKVIGNVWAIIDDDAGGWYLGGDFTSVGGLPRQRLAHVLSDYSVGTWNPGADGRVETMAKAGNLIYLGGEFQSAGGSSRSRIAAINATTGVASNWNPNANDEVAEIVVSGSTIYAAGNFTDIGSASRAYVAALNANNGHATSWNPNPTAPVAALALSGTTLYCAGGFTSFAGQPRGRGAAIDVTTGNLLPWDPVVDASSVLDISVAGSTVYLCGAFSHVGIASRSMAGAVDATTGAVTTWAAPAIDFYATRIVADGSRVYVCGKFTTVGGQPRNSLAVLDAGTGALNSWYPAPGGEVLVIHAGSSMLFGGYFSSLGGAARKYAAAIDLNTRTVTDWAPNPNSYVFALASIGSDIFLGGQFSSVGGAAREALGAVDAITGTATTWNANLWGDLTYPAGNYRSAIVRSLAAYGGMLYVGGRFTMVGGQGRSGLAEIDGATAVPSSWGPSGGNINVGDIVTDGARLYFANQPEGFIALNVGGLTIGTGSYWYDAADPVAPGAVDAVLVSGPLLYAGGRFSEIDSQARDHLAALDATTGAVQGWNPGADGAVSAIGKAGSSVFVGGEFDAIGGSPRTYLAAVDAATGTATSWDPVLDGSVECLLVSGQTLFVGGGFGTVDGLPIRSLAAFDLGGTTAVPPGGDRTQTVQMAAAIPHPVRDAAVVRFTLPRQTRVTLALVDAAGRQVRTLMNSALLEAGPHDVRIERRGLAAGLYFLALRSDAGDAARKIVMLP